MASLSGLSLVKNVQETGYSANAQRRLATASVIEVDTTTATCTLDPGTTDVNGNSVLMLNVPYNRQTQPAVGDVVPLNYGVSESPHGIQLGAGLVGGSNVGQTVTSAGVNEIFADTSPTLQGNVNLLSGAVGLLSQTGQAITVNPASTVEHGGTLVGSELKINLVDSGTVTFTVTDDPTDSRVNITAASSGGIVDVEHGGANVATEPKLNFIDGGGITFTVADDSANSRVNVSGAIGLIPDAPEYTITAETANYVALSTDCVIVVTAAGTANVTVTLPAANSAQGKFYVIKSYIPSSTFGVLTAPAGTDTIELVATPYGPTRMTGAQFGWAQFLSDGVSNWIVITTN